MFERDSYALRMDILLHLHERERTAGHDASTLQASEFAHSRSLVQMLNEQSQAKLTTSDPAHTKRLNDLRQHIATLTNEQLRLRISGTAGTLRETVQRNLATALAEMDQVTMEIRDSNPRLAALTLPEPLKLCEMQKQILDRDTILLEYALGEERSSLFVVSADALHTFSLPSRKVIEPVARQFYETLSRRQQPKAFANVAEKQTWLRSNNLAAEKAGDQLSALLFKPAASLLSDKRLLIVADGLLHFVPFAALPSPGGEELRVSGSEFRGKRNKSQPTTRATQNSKPLIVDHEIVSLPSASTLALMRRESAGRKPAPKTLVVLADPVFDAHDERLTLRPPHPFTDATTRTVELTRQLRTFGDKDEARNFLIPRLPASRVEAETILGLVPSDERKAALDFDASYQTATQGDLDQYRFVHFATHGLLDEIHPELSGLLLTQVNRQGGTENGYFTTLDAFNLKLNAELVVLSECRTALGKEIKGEGLMGLTRGFMYAGAKRVMASLWQVNDEATAELMEHFYQGMLGEKKLLPAAALRAAQLEMRKDKKWSSPYYWAAFTLQGEW